MNFDDLGKAFVPHFTGLFDSNKPALAPLFQNESMMTLDGEKFQGAQAIVTRLSALPALQHQVQTTDCQPSTNNGVVIFITSNLNIPGQEPIKCSEAFNLMPGGGSYYVLNYCFRTNR